MKHWCIRGVVFLIAAMGAAAAPVLSVASWRLHWPAWIVWCSIPAAMVITWLLLQRLLPLTARPVNEDQSLPWREFHAVRRLELVGDDGDDLSLVLELGRERGDVASTAVRFDGVSRLAMNHRGLWTFGFDGLVCEVLRKHGRDGARFAIRDPHGEAIAFRCRSFAQVVD